MINFDINFYQILISLILNNFYIICDFINALCNGSNICLEVTLIRLKFI